MEQESMSVEKVLEATARILNDIQVPVSMVETIGIPLCAAAGNLKACLDAIRSAEEKPEGGAGDGREADTE